MSRRTQAIGWAVALGLAAASGQALDADAASRVSYKVSYRQAKGYQVYSAEIGPNDGCLADYVQSYKGWSKKPVTKKKRKQGWTSLKVPGRGWYVTLDKYSKECDREYPACQAEDDYNCIWNAKERGDRTGTSFINIRGKVYYISGMVAGY